MTVREGLGLVLAVSGTVLLPMGWMVHSRLLVVALVLQTLGVVLLLTERVRKRAERIEQARDGRGVSASGMPSDTHNHSGWRTGGRRETFESSGRFSDDMDAD